MRHGHVFSKRLRDRGVDDPDEVQDVLANRSYVQHDHGGREHGHDWDDWLKADRALKVEGNSRKGRGRFRI